jgi:hypothetical protein
MDEDNTTPESNLPDNNEDKYGKTHYQGNKRAYSEHNDWYGSKPITHEPISKKEQSSVYDEILEDLIDIVAKLLKELGKRK